jgi:hypothetical protein
MKHLLTPFILCLAFTTFAQQHKLEKLWQTDTIVAVPESVLPDFKNNILYVSLIDGGPWDADGKGGVGRLSINGKKYNGSWVTGLNAPKGMGKYGNRLFVADINEVAAIDIKKGTVQKKISIPGAEGLNDVTVSDNGIVYVSDSRTAKIWKIENDVPSVYLENIKGVNGLKAVKNDLYIGAGKSFVKADAQKKLHTIVELPQGIDGIEPVGNGDFILTAWAGYIFYVHAKGKFETLLETHLEKKNSADIGFDHAKRVVYVPTFNGKTVVAYQLK